MQEDQFVMAQFMCLESSPYSVTFRAIVSTMDMEHMIQWSNGLDRYIYRAIDLHDVFSVQGQILVIDSGCYSLTFINSFNQSLMQTQ